MHEGPCSHTCLTFSGLEPAHQLTMSLEPARYQRLKLKRKAKENQSYRQLWGEVSLLNGLELRKIEARARCSSFFLEPARIVPRPSKWAKSGMMKCQLRARLCERQEKAA